MSINQEIMNTCPAAGSCKQYGKMCNEVCPFWIDIQYQLQLSGIPKRHRGYRVDTLPSDTYALNLIQKWSSNDMERINSGQGLFLFGSTGTGKTTIAVAIAQTYIVNQSKEWLKTGELTSQLVQFINTADLFDLLKKGFNDDDAQSEGYELIERIKNAKLVIFDDLGSEKPSEYVRERLYTLINYRYTEMKATIFTSNNTMPELIETLEKRIPSRIQEMTAPLEIKGTDRRRKI